MWLCLKNSVCKRWKSNLEMACLKVSLPILTSVTTLISSVTADGIRDVASRKLAICEGSSAVRRKRQPQWALQFRIFSVV